MKLILKEKLDLYKRMHRTENKPYMSKHKMYLALLKS